MASLQGLTRIPRIHNKKYVRSGPKSYAWLLQKWGFEPTLPGPLFQMQKNERTGIFSRFHKHSKKSQTHTVLGKKDASGQAGEVTAEDIQNDSEYL